VVPGSAANAGAFLDADLEGLALVAPLPGRTVLLASSQGDDSFHFYEVRGARPRHLGEFVVDGVGETDGIHYVSVPLGRRYPLGLLVVQNGEAPQAGAPDEVNGYEFDGSTQFQYLSFLDALRTLHP
jgi:3-phytase